MLRASAHRIGMMRRFCASFLAVGIPLALTFRSSTGHANPTTDIGARTDPFSQSHSAFFTSQTSFEGFILAPEPLAMNLLYLFCAGVILLFVVAELLRRLQRRRHPLARQVATADLPRVTTESIAILDAEARVIEANQGFQRDVGLSAAHILGRPIWALHKLGFGKAYWQSVLAQAQTAGTWTGATRTLGATGQAEAHDIAVTARRAHQSDAALYEFRSRRQLKPVTATAPPRPLRLMDPQTVLPNRRAMKADVDLAIARAKAAGNKLAIMVIDLDRFGDINAIFGDDIGDQVLERLAENLRRIASPGVTIGRVGGDEFLLLIERITQPEALLRLARDVAVALGDELAIDGLTTRLSASIGIAQYPDDGSSQRSLMQAAGVSLCDAKAKGRGHVSFYSSTMETRSEESIQLENDLGRAVAQGELLMHYQPQLDLRTGQCIGAEALLRWQHPKKGLLLPGGFVPLALDAGLTCAIDRFVLQEVCAQIGTWQKAGLAPMKISVNMSAMSLLTPDFATQLLAISGQHDVDPTKLEIEILESTMFPRMTTSFTTMDDLHAMGVSLAIDDFGTGYSSLSLLKDLPIGRLKLDRRFVKNLPQNVKDDRIVGAVVAMGRSLGIDVIAEGVETEAQQKRLIALGCTQAQGFLYSRPISAADLEQKWMTRDMPASYVGSGA